MLEHKIELVNLRKQTTALAFNKKRTYYAEKIDECKGNSKSLFSSLNKLLDEDQTVFLPNHDPPVEFAEKFKTYFKDKITNTI